MTLINRHLIIIVSLAALLAGCDSLGIKKSAHEKNPKETPTDTPLVQEQPPVVLSAESQEQKFNTVWERIRAGYGLPETSNNAIDSQLHFYTRYKSYFYKIT